MGAYLSQPNTAKTSSDGGNKNMSYGFSAMQGWRVSMEVMKTQWVHRWMFCHAGMLPQVYELGNSYLATHASILAANTANLIAS